MEKEIDGRPWYALIAGAVGTMEPAGRVLSELVGREECTEGARFAQVVVINRLAREEPYTLTRWLQRLGGETWSPGDVNYFFDRCTESEAYHKRVRHVVGTMRAHSVQVTVPDLCFEHAIERAWNDWFEKRAAELPAMPEGLADEFERAVQHPLRRDLGENLHNIIKAMPEWLKQQGAEGYGTEFQYPYPKIIDGFTNTAGKFLRHAQERAEMLLQSNEQAQAEIEQALELARG